MHNDVLNLKIQIYFMGRLWALAYVLLTQQWLGFILHSLGLFKVMTNYKVKQGALKFQLAKKG